MAHIQTFFGFLIGAVMLAVLPVNAMALTAYCYHDPQKMMSGATNTYINDPNGLADTTVTIHFNEATGTTVIETRIGEETVVDDSVKMIGDMLKGKMPAGAEKVYPFTALGDGSMTVYVLAPEKQTLIISTMDFTVPVKKGQPPSHKAVMAHCDIR